MRIGIVVTRRIGGRLARRRPTLGSKVFIASSRSPASLVLRAGRSFA
ncbi:hypothetical protein [Pseudorhodoferax sp.]|nr:hypothetical protein [Pseudorhodoferax sp.]